MTKTPKIVSNARSTPPEGTTLTSTDLEIMPFGQWETVNHQVISKELAEGLIINLPFINVDKIEERYQDQPLIAAKMLGHASRISDRGHHFRRRYELAAAYKIATLIAFNERQVQFLTDALIESGEKLGVTFDKVNSNVIHYCFLYIFFCLGKTTRNRATQYALSLHHYFEKREEPAKVKSIIIEKGSEKLYRNHLERQAERKYIESKSSRKEDSEGSIETAGEAHSIASVNITITRQSPSPFELDGLAANQFRTSFKPDGERSVRRTLDPDKRFIRPQKEFSALVSKSELYRMIESYASATSRHSESEFKDSTHKIVALIKGLIDKI